MKRIIALSLLLVVSLGSPAYASWAKYKDHYVWYKVGRHEPTTEDARQWTIYLKTKAQRIKRAKQRNDAWVKAQQVVSIPVTPSTTYTSASSSTGSLDWDAIAACESGGNWSIYSPPYYGGLQEDMAFWTNYGGLAYASRPDLASKSEQITVAERGLAAQGIGAWPTCGVYG